MKVLTIIARWLFIVFLPLLMLSASIGVAFNSLWLYQAGFEKYGISQVTGLADTELEKAARGLISYFNSREQLIDVIVEKDGQPFTLFNEREVIHLKDVKALVWLDYKILLWSLFYVLAYVVVNVLRPRPGYLRRLAKSVAIGSGLTLAILLALGLTVMFNFSGFFLLFHLISFSNDFWQLDPATDYLIMLFPGGFWYDAVILIAIQTAGAAILLGILSVGHLVFNKNDRS